MDLHAENNSEIRWIPDGFHFRGPEKSLVRRNILNKITAFFQSAGYQEVFLPSFDYSATFTGHLTHNDKNSVIKGRDYNGNEISPSFDPTIQVVKGMAGNEKSEANYIFYITSVIRDNELHNGRRRETLQAGAEVIGRSDLSSVTLLIKQINDIIQLFALNDLFVLVIGNTEIFKNITSSLALDKNEISYFSGLFYAKDWTRIDRFLQEKKATQTAKNLIRSLLFDFDLEQIALKIKDSEFKEAEKIISETISITDQNKLKICPDFSLVRDLDYYTGYIFHGYLKGYSEPLITGGVYNQLYEKFADGSKNACGFAINIDLLEELLEKNKGN